MLNMTFLTAPKIVCKSGGLSDELGALALSLLSNQPVKPAALIVTDPGITQCGYTEQAAESLRKVGFTVATYDQVQADPPYSVVREAIAVGQDINADIVIGLGGGSSMDTAKIVALAMHSSQSLDDMVGVEQATGERLPLIAVPTTAGTGSEVTFVSVLTGDAGDKKAIYSAKLLPDIALLDATLTVGMPRHVTAAPALDAMVHCVEAYTSRTKKNPISDALAIKGLQLLTQNYMTVLEDGTNLVARENMLLGSTLAGMAFVNASVAAVHGLSYPLGTRFHVPHGHSNALVMGPVFRFNIAAASQQYAELAQVILPQQSFTDEVSAAHAFVDTLEGFLEQSGMPTRLNELGVVAADLLPMATEVVEKIARLIATNPRDMTVEDVEQIYRSVL